MAPDGLESLGSAVGVSPGCAGASGAGSGLQASGVADLTPGALDRRQRPNERKEHLGRWEGAVWAPGAVSPPHFPEKSGTEQGMVRSPQRQRSSLAGRCFPADCPLVHCVGRRVMAHRCQAFL